MPEKQMFRAENDLGEQSCRLCGGGRGIRTPGTLSGTAVFKTACFNRSHIPPLLILAVAALPSAVSQRALFDASSRHLHSEHLHRILLGLLLNRAIRRDTYAENSFGL